MNRHVKCFALAMAAACAAPPGLALARTPLRAPMLVPGAPRAQTATAWPTVVAPWATERVNAYAATHPRPVIARPFRKDAVATMWLSDGNGYIWQLSSTGIVVGALTDCAGPHGIKVDHAGNLWAVCSGTETIQEYAPGAASATLVLDDAAGFVPVDVAVDSNGNVYASNIDGFDCSSSSCTVYDGNVVYWLAPYLASGETPSGAINDPNIYEGYFLDVDSNGNLYVDMLNAASLGGETDEIVDPLGSSKSILNLNINPGYPGGVYVSNGGTILNVLDQNALVITRYDLSSGGFPRKLGKLPENWEKTCDPIAMGFSLGDTNVGVGDVACNAFDSGVVKTNKFKQLLSSSFQQPMGAAYMVSDK